MRELWQHRLHAEPRAHDRRLVPGEASADPLAEGRRLVPRHPGRRRPRQQLASWQWVAGSGTDAAPYFRIFNPVLQGTKFDPSGDYVRRWVPNLPSCPRPTSMRPGTRRRSCSPQAGVTLGPDLSATPSSSTLGARPRLDGLQAPSGAIEGCGPRPQLLCASRRTALLSGRRDESPASALAIAQDGLNDARARSASAVAHPVRLHHLLPHPLSVLHHRACRLAGRARGAVAQDRQADLLRHRAALDQDLRRVLRHGRGLRRRALLRVRHQLERAVAPRRQRHRPADVLRGADRLLPRGGLPRHHAVRLEPRAEVGAFLRHLHGGARHRDLGLLDPVGQ